MTTINIFVLLAGMVMASLSPAPIWAQTPAPPAAAPRATLSEFAWLAGHWAGTGLGGSSEEMWMPAAGGAMLGSFRQLKDGAVVFYELLTLVERDNTVVLRLKHFNADLTGWEEKAQVLEFRLVELTATKAVFDAMTFTREGDDAFRVALRLRDRKTNDVREEIFVYKRVQPRR
jgi:hypothetical protein